MMTMMMMMMMMMIYLIYADVEVDVDYVYGWSLRNANYNDDIPSFSDHPIVQKLPLADVHQVASGVSSRPAGAAGRPAVQRICWAEIFNSRDDTTRKPNRGRFPLFQANLGWWNIMLEISNLIGQHMFKMALNFHYSTQFR